MKWLDKINSHYKKREYRVVCNDEKEYAVQEHFINQSKDDWTFIGCMFSCCRENNVYKSYNEAEEIMNKRKNNPHPDGKSVLKDFSINWQEVITPCC